MILNQIDSGSSSTTQVPSTTPAQSTSGSIAAGLSSTQTLNENDFLSMLITELQNQDPTNPLQSTDLAAQLAQFSEVSELQTMDTDIQNSTNANLVLTQSINNTMAATLIGKEVKVNSSTIVYDGSTQPGVGVTLNGNAADVQVQIKDSAGDVVRTIDAGPKLSGDNTIAWDGKDNLGNQMQAGNYTFSITASDSAGNSVTSSSYALGVVQGVKYSSTGTVLIVNGSSINLSDVEEVFGGN